MEQVRSGYEWWLPLLIFGYFESLRRTTFLAFGWVEHGITFIAITVLIIYLATLDLAPVQKLRLWAARLMILAYMGLVGYFSYLYDPAHKSFLPNLIFGVPDFGQGTLSHTESATFAFFLVFGYAVLVFLISNFILEKKSYLEIFAASALMLGVEIAVADYKLTVPVLIHVFFIMLLRNQLCLQEAADVPDIVIVKGKKSVHAGWYVAGAALTLAGMGVALLLPAHDADRQELWAQFKPAQKAQQAASQAVRTNDDIKQDSFYYFWDRLNDFEMQGSLNITDIPALWVKAGEPFYWRGETADFYTGRGWRSTAQLEGEKASGQGLPNPYSKHADVSKVEQTFILAPGMSSRLVFAANTPAFVELPSGKFKWDEADNVFVDYLSPGSGYKVVSYVPKFDAGKLRKTVMSYPVEIRKKYLQLPPKISARVKNKARSITTLADNAYDKAKAVERYLSENYPYELTVAATPKGKDVVDYFLFDLKKGYCTYHSTAMVVMLRSVGIPARWAKGYMTGSLNPETGVYEVSQADAHAWVEVYFSDFGWIPFEPTASFSLPETQAATAETEQLTEEAGDVQVITDPAALPPEESERVARSLIFLAFFAILSGGGMLWVFFIRKKRFKAKQNYDQVRDVYLDLLALLQYKGFPRAETATPYEYAQSLAVRLPEEYPDIMAITELYIRYQYSKTMLTEAETEEAMAVWRRLSDRFLQKQKD